MKGFMGKLLAITLAISLCACSSAPKYQKVNYYQSAPDLANMKADYRCTNESSFKQSSPGCPAISQSNNLSKGTTDIIGAWAQMLTLVFLFGYVIETETD